jgi:hypothetical protein
MSEEIKIIDPDPVKTALLNVDSLNIRIDYDPTRGLESKCFAWSIATKHGQIHTGNDFSGCSNHELLTAHAAMTSITNLLTREICRRGQLFDEIKTSESQRTLSKFVFLTDTESTNDPNKN